MPIDLGIALGTPLASRNRKSFLQKLARFLLGALRKSLMLNDLRKDGCEAPRLRNRLGHNDLDQISSKLGSNFSMSSSFSIMRSTMSS